MPTGIVLGLVLAVLAHQRLRGIAIFRTIFSSTVITSVAVASLISFTLLNPQIGLLNYWLGRDAAGSRRSTTRRGRSSAVAGVTIWQNLGLSFIIMSAGLQAVPDELLEAARVDGAGAWSRFRNVTLPLLSPTLFFAVVVGSILAFQSFGQIDLLTQGGPRAITRTCSCTRSTRTVFQENNDGKAAVLAVALFVITLCAHARATALPRTAGAAMSAEVSARCVGRVDARLPRVPDRRRRAHRRCDAARDRRVVREPAAVLRGAPRRSTVTCC